MKPIVILAELDPSREQVRPGIRELATCAEAVREVTRGPVTVVVPGRDTGRVARSLALESGLATVGLDIPEYPGYNSVILQACLRDLLTGMGPSHILVGHTAQARDFGPGLALSLGGVCLPGVTRVEAGQGLCRFVRPVQGGRMDARLEPGGEPVVVLVQPGAFQPAVWSTPDPSAETVGRVRVRVETARPDPALTDRIRNLGSQSPAPESSDLARARVIVAGGRGMETPRDLEILQDLADLFPGSALGASRPVIDAGWLAHRFQVGITGAVVSPGVYLALGISGSTQHLAGIRGAGFVVAVNSDPGAAIFRHSDLCIVEDFREFVQAFTAVANASRKGSVNPGRDGEKQ